MNSDQDNRRSCHWPSAFVPLLGRVHQGPLRARMPHRAIASISGAAHDRCRTIRKDAGLLDRFPPAPLGGAEKFTDGAHVMEHRCTSRQISGAALRGRCASFSSVAAGRRPALAHLLHRRRPARSRTNVIDGYFITASRRHSASCTGSHRISGTRSHR